MEYSAYLSIRGARSTDEFQQDVADAIELAVESNERAPGLEDPLRWLEFAATIGRLGRLAGARWSASWREPADDLLARWWMGVAMGDASACRAARDALRVSRKRSDSQSWIVRPALSVEILDALDAGDASSLQAGIERLLTEHDERAHPQATNVVGRLSVTPIPMLACWPAMAFIAEARRRRLRIAVDSAYLTPGFRTEGASTTAKRPRRHRTAGVVLNPDDADRWLRDIEKVLSFTSSANRQPNDYHDGWDHVVELNMRRADYWSGLASLDESAVHRACAARTALADVARLVPRAHDQLVEHGRPGAPAWMLAMGTEAELIVGRGAPPATPNLIVSTVESAGVDEACCLAMRALARGDDATARAAAGRLRLLPAGADDVPHVRRFPPEIIADALDAIAGGDRAALGVATERLLEWHAGHAEPQPKGSRHATTPELFMVSWTTLALAAVATSRGMNIRLEHPHAPLSLLFHVCKPAGVPHPEPDAAPPS